MRIIPIGLRFVDQLTSLSTVLVDELQQLVASIQAMFASVVTEIQSIQAQWVDITYSSTNYSTNGSGLITPSSAAPNVYRYKLIGKTLLLTCTAKVAIGNGTTTEVRFKIPTTNTAKKVSGVGGVGDNTQRTAGVYSASGGTAGVTLAAINAVGGYVSVQRYDGAPAAAFPNGQDVTLGFMIQIPLV